MTPDNPPSQPVAVSCTVHAPAGDVVAGRPFTLSVDVVSDDGSDLRGSLVKVQDSDARTVHTLTLATYVDGVSSTGPVDLDPPTTTGRHRWRVIVAPHARRGIRYGGCDADLEFDVVPHPLRVQVWGYPESVRQGTSFDASIGAKGSPSAPAAGRPYRVLDDAGRIIAEGVLGQEPRPGTDGLYAASVTLEAGGEPGVRRFSVAVDGVEAPVPHADGATAFSLTVAPEPQHVLTVRVRDHVRDAPVAGAQVVVHPYRCRTDTEGVARLQVSSGEHVLFVSGFAYETYRVGITVDADLEVDAALIEEHEADPGDLYM